MACNKLIIGAILSLFCAYYAYAQVQQQQQQQGQTYQMDQICLGCICEAASGCNTTVGCVGDVCGPFRITWGYWADAGKPTVGNQPATSNTAFARCVNDVNCAARAVQGYMEKYSQDCNGDGVIDCEDYARIHYLGGYGCLAAAKLDKNYAKAFNFCQKAFQAV
ncbi:hypothetical protein TKK_0007143 [Trichogramma kaykai]